MLTDEQTDRELLELAAKAAGVPAYWSVDGTLQNRPMFVVRAGGGMGTMPYEAAWNPLRYDVDAFRLAVKLEIDIFHSDILVRAMHRAREGSSVAVRVNDDRFAATRRAIVRAAVESRKEQPK